MASLKTHDIPAIPENYALWYDYHAAVNSGLTRTINTLLSNRVSFDEKTLRDLYRGFLSTAREEQAVREASLQALATLQELIGLTDAGRADAQHFGATLTGFAAIDLGKSMKSLKTSIEHLVSESSRIASRTEFLGIRMQESSEKIQTLERNLESALRDATMDELTGVANRKSFDQTLRKLAGDAMNSGEDLALLMIDIDHFKRVNDTWGHLTGDAVLRHVASTLQHAIRDQDYLARYGGEEFSVLLPSTDLHSAFAVAERIRRLVETSPPSLDLNPPLQAVTVSIGAASYEHGDPLSDWMHRGDSALYQAKAAGRNQVSCLEGVTQ